MELAQQLNPRDPRLYAECAYLARAYVNARNFDAAIAKARQAAHLQSDYAPAHFILAVALALAGRDAEAGEALRRAEEAAPGIVAAREGWQPYTDPASNAFLAEGLAKARWAMEAE